MKKIDQRAIIMGLFLPSLFWTGSVIAISLMGYPGVVCMTPLAWLLALPVGMRVRRESESLGKLPALEATLAGGLLGLWQGLLVPAVMVASPYLPGKISSAPPSSIFAAIISTIISIPVTAGLAGFIAVWMSRNKNGI